MKQIAFLFSIALLTAGVTSHRAEAELIIADQGKSTFSIVVPEKAPDSVTTAAQELQRSIAQSTGAKLLILKDNEKTTEPIISLGSTVQAQAAGITPRGIADSGFRIVTKSGNLYIIGLDTVAKVDLSQKSYGQMTPQPEIPGPQFTKDGGFSNGTANGVYTFLEDYLGVRWLMPGDLGRDVPTKKTLKIANLDRIKTPEFVYRVLPFLERYWQSIPAVASWQNQQKLGFSFNLNHNHYWEETVPADLYKEHPDWFSMIDGKRVQPTNTYNHKIETTNPEVVRYYAEKAIAALKANPQMNTYSLSPTDGRGWSESPESKALFEPNPSKKFDPEATPGFPSVTPLMLKFYRDVAEIVAKEYPQGKLSGYFYSDYMWPPLKGGMTLPDNFTPTIAPSFDYGYRLYRDDVQKQFDYVMNSWAKVAPPTWFYYDLPNAIIEPYNSGMVTPPGTSILNFIFPRLLKSHIKGAYFYGNTAWSQAALTNYIGAKLLWDPKLNADDVQREWLNRAYGSKAGMVMEQYYKELDSRFKVFYQQNEEYNYHTQESLFSQLYAPHYAKLEKLFLQAKAQPMSGLQKQRLQLIEENMIALQWRLRNGGYLKEFVSPLQRNGDQVRDLMFDGQYIRQTSDNAFDIFPVLWTDNQPFQPLVKVALNETPSQEATQEFPNDGKYIFLYAKQAGTVNLKAGNVDSGSAFVGYCVYEPKDNSYFNLLQQGLFYSRGTISFEAKANTIYILSIKPQGFVSPKLDYDLSIPGATMATGSFAADTLYLTGKDAPLYVFISNAVKLNNQETANGVTLSSQSPAAAALAAALQQRTGSKILLNLDDNWRFQTDPQKDGLQQGFVNSSYNDQSWKTITATRYWQDQGYANYHGTAWYRRSFDLPATAGKTVLFFGAVDGDAVVYLNDQKVGEHLPSQLGEGWDQPFALDVTANLNVGQNTIVIEVTKDIFASGIYGGVSLLSE